MAGIDNNTLFYLRGDSLKDLSFNNIPIVNQGATVIDNSINLDNGYFTCNTGFKDINTTKYWTIEWEEYSTGNATGGCVICNKPFTPAHENGFIVGYYHSNQVYLGSNYNTPTWNGFSSIIVKDKIDNVWVHWALVRNDNSFTMYKNGVKYWSGATSILPYAWDNNGFAVGMWYGPTTIEKGYKANIKDFRISNVARYTEDFTPPTQPFNSITINKTNQTDTNIEFNIEKLGQETINKVEVLVNGTVSETYSDNYDSINYLIDTELCSIGNNKITIRVTFDDVYTEELSLTHTYTVDELPLETPLLDTVKRVKLLTKSKQYEKNMLSSILTSKNVEVTEEDKMSDLIGKVDLLGEYDGPILYLYKEGDECTDVTGGWGITNSSHNVTTPTYERTDRLRAHIVCGNSNGHHCGFISNKAIDLTGYSKIYFDMSNYHTDEFDRGLINIKSGSSSVASIGSPAYENAPRQIREIDISNINTSCIIQITAETVWNGKQAEVVIYNIWLEK